MAESADRPILIAGAGVAGLTAAIALARAGFSVVVIERATRFEEIGAGLQLSPNASRILIELGLGSAVSRRALAPEALDVRRLDDSRVLTRMPMTDAGARFGAPFWMTLRADLQTALIDAARADSRIALMVGRTVEQVEETPQGVAVHVVATRGAETIEGAALIGADGLWSRVRALIDAETTPRFIGNEAWRALLPIDKAPETARRAAVQLWMGRDAHLVHYPVAGGRFVNVVFIRQAPRPRSEAERVSWNAAGDPRDLAYLQRITAEPARELIAAVPSWQIWSLYDCPPLKRVARGRVALIGDAAHPVPPFLAQGAALAIEDAAVLAQEAAKTPDDLAQAFSRFAARRRRRVFRAQGASRANGRAYHAGGVKAWVRDRILARLGGESMLKRYQWLYGWTPDA